MARPKEFDRYKVLKAAIAVFSQKSYSATSIDDLLEVMNIGRQSFYDTFKDKRSLYIEALTLYLEETHAHITNLFEEAASPLGAIENLIYNAALDNEEQRALSCMGISTICEFGTSDPEITAIGRHGSQRLEHALKCGLLNAKSHGEISVHMDEAAAARFIMAILIGMRVKVRAGCSPEFVRQIAVFAISSLSANIFQYMPYIP